MARPPKINKEELATMFEAGKTVAECAEHFGVSHPAISQARRQLRTYVAKNVSLERAHETVGKSINAVEQLTRINQRANDMLDNLQHDPANMIRVMGEIRMQLKLQMEIFQCLYDMEAVAEFQKAVLYAIGEVAPDVRDRIIQSLAQQRAIRSAVVVDPH